jgi:hypothetical protein
VRVRVPVVNPILLPVDRESETMLLLDVRVEQIVYFGMIVDLFRSLAALEAEIVVLRQQLIVAVGSSAVGQVLQATRTVPIVFVFAPDPVGSGFVNSLSRPGGNFMAFEYSLRGRSLCSASMQLHRLFAISPICTDPAADRVWFGSEARSPSGAPGRVSSSTVRWAMAVALE